ncbi:hypothetical protein, partial [Rhodovulum sulfidophilum]|uniref:hypothetical protein n=1 Tax=Rhodovulum sulfidophilum TaxID=35806 RepID=UPI001F34FC31
MTPPPQTKEGETDSGKIGAHRLLVARYGCPRVTAPAEAVWKRAGMGFRMLVCQAARFGRLRHPLARVAARRSLSGKA